MKTLSRSTLEKEYRRCDRLLAKNRNPSDYDKALLYGGRQALGWALRDNCSKPSSCITSGRKP